MTDSFVRIVLDDAEDHQKLGAITLSELRAQQIEALREMLPQKLVDALAGKKLTPEPLQAIVAKVVDVGMTSIDRGIEKLKLRLPGRAHTH